MVKNHVYIPHNCKIMQSKGIMIAYKLEKNLKKLLTRANPFKTINILGDKIHTYVPCYELIHVRTLWSQRVVLNVSLQK